MELVLVRHAQPAWTREERGVHDPGLTDVGRRQAELVADRLAQRTPDVLVASTATRSQETAEAIADACGRDVLDEPRLHEIHAPDWWDGSPLEQIQRTIREARTRPIDEWWDGLPEGESFHDFHDRVTHGLDDLLRRFGCVRVSDEPGSLYAIEDPDLRVCMVTHVGTNSVALGHLLGIAPHPWEWERFASAHASVTILRSAPIAGRRLFSLRRFSDVSHLPEGLVTQ